MEAAGLVLGVIPLVIKGLNTYREILSSVRNARRDLGYLILDLETERQILQNTCEILLKGIVPDSVLDDLIEKPFAKDWETYNNEVQLRLWRSSNVFKEHIGEMREAALEMQRKLGIDGDGETRFSDRSAILKEWKYNTYFSLNKKDYKDILGRLKDGNAVLTTLATQNSELEPNRRSRSQAKLAQIIRKLSQDAYAAFRSVLTCTCPHDLGLGMTAISRKDAILPGEDIQGAASAIPLDIVLESGAKAQRWSGLRVQLAQRAGPPMSPTATSPSSLPRSKSPRRIRWSSSLTVNTCGAQTAAQMQSSSYLSTSLQFGSATLPSTITDLCHTLRKGKHKASATNDCFGNITFNSRKFNIYQQDCQPDHLSAISLGTILEDQHQWASLIKFSYTERLKLALALSYSVLHLYKTPWLARIVTPKDILFLGEQQQDSSDAAYHLGRPFLAKTQSSTAPNTTQTQPAQTQPAQTQPAHAEGRPMDLTILSLGLLLIQIIIGRQISDLALAPDMRINLTLSKKEMASKYIRSVTESGGKDYADAVEWCLGSILSVACLDDEKFAQEFYNAVIMRLEGDLGLQSLKTVSGSEA